jgi:hypothetical protein
MGTDTPIKDRDEFEALGPPRFRLQEDRLRRRWRPSGGGPAQSVIQIVPTPMTALTTSPAGYVVGSMSVVGGAGGYTFSFVSNPGGLFTIVGNLIQLTAPISTPGTYPITIMGDNGAGDHPVISTYVIVSAPTTYVPTYHIYGF